MRILIQSNAEWAPTGYGVQARHLVSGFEKLGHTVAVFPFWGLQGGIMEYQGHTCYPIWNDIWGNDIFMNHARHFKADIVISLMDVWVMHENFGNMVRWIPWLPIDHSPAPEPIVQRLRSALRVVAFSKFGVKELGNAGIKADYVPHGVDINAFKPLDIIKGELKKQLGFPSDCFLIGMVAANKGWPCRKCFPEIFEAFSEFVKRHPETRLYCHSESSNRYGGPDLQLMSRGFGITEYIRFAEPYLLNLGFPDDLMCQIYNAMDVLCAVSMGEGFGIPILEAQSCFPSDTFVTAEDIIGIQERSYSGDIITIETAKGTIEVTPEHPFWTNNDWVLAKDLTENHQLWYNKEYTLGGGYAQEGLQKIQSGSIGEIVHTIQNHAPQRGSSKSRTDLWSSILANTTSRNSQNNWAKDNFEVSTINRSRMGLFSRIDRWRGHNFNQKAKRTGQQLEANNLHIQQFPNVNGMVAEKDNLCKYPNRKTQVSEGMGTSISILDNGDRVSSPIQETITLIGNKTNTLPFDNSMGTRKISSRNTRENQQEATRDNPNTEGFEREAIIEIRTRKVKNLPVYNLATKSHVYVAQGFIVHNCGIPVITTDFSSMPELTAAGWKVPVARRWWTPLNSFQALPNIDGIIEAMEAAYQADRKALGKVGREFAMGYRWEKIINEGWKPILDSLEPIRYKEYNIK